MTESKVVLNSRVYVTASCSSRFTDDTCASICVCSMRPSHKHVPARAQTHAHARALSLKHARARAHTHLGKSVDGGEAAKDCRRDERHCEHAQQYRLDPRSRVTTHLCTCVCVCVFVYTYTLYRETPNRPGGTSRRHANAHGERINTVVRSANKDAGGTADPTAE